MKVSKKVCPGILAAVILITLLIWLPELPAQTAAAQSSAQHNDSTGPQWSVQVDRVDPAGVNLEPAFRIAIYENLLHELPTTKRFKKVLRSGDRNASGVPDLLILKAKIEKYTPGSETRRAVTTVSGATKLSVRSQLCTRNGQVILEQVVDGDVRFFGGNLRATHNLARNVANKIKQSTLPQATLPRHEERNEGPAVAAARPLWDSKSRGDRQAGPMALTLRVAQAPNGELD
jgi:hypothetical protein